MLSFKSWKKSAKTRTWQSKYIDKQNQNGEIAPKTEE